MKYIVVFKDSHSGGRIKFYNRDWIFVSVTAEDEDAARAKAVCLLHNVYNINAYNKSCSCCGSDYDITVEKDLREATAFKRNCDVVDGNWIERSRFEGKDIVNYNYWGKHISLTDYLNEGLKNGTMFFIHEANHKNEQTDNFAEIVECAYIDRENNNDYNY